MTGLPFSESSALVTGASNGIGRALAVELARRKTILALVGRDAARLAETARLCQQAGAARVETFAFDLAKVEAIETLVADIEQRLGGTPSLTIHAAGALLLARVEEYPLADAQSLMNVNLMAGFALARALVPRLKAKGGGTLGFISSGTAYRAVPFQWAYAASKAGIERLAEALRVELSGTAVKVRVVSPGPVGTVMLNNPPSVGSVPMLSRVDTPPTPESLAPAILAAFASSHARTDLTMRVRIIRWLSALGAEPFDTMLRRRM
jgi:short-subunit dehydrogenase